MPGRVFQGLVLFAAIAAGPGTGRAGVPAGNLPSQALVDATRTSIYLGSVRLTLSPFLRRDGAFAADYAAKVVPFFLFSEKGHLSIEFSDDQLRQLERGETVYFKGQAHNSAGRERRIEGRAVPEGAGFSRGKIKVRVYVGKIQLIFNSAYHFAPAE